MNNMENTIKGHFFKNRQRVKQRLTLLKTNTYRVYKNHYGYEMFFVDEDNREFIYRGRVQLHLVEGKNYEITANIKHDFSNTYIQNLTINYLSVK